MKKTSTYKFGSGNRINHDSTEFYNLKIYEELKEENKKAKPVENKIPEEFLNKIFCKSSENMSEIPNNSVHLIITSPPYNVGKEYDENLSLEEYRDFLKRVFSECFRVLVDGGRICINIANIGRKPYIPLHAFIIQDMLDIGYLMRGEIIWDKGNNGVSTAWGSWKSASNPVLRDVHEYILVFQKGSFKRERKNKEDTISKEEFLEFTKSIWSFKPESAKKVGHPAPFPIELPKRCIQLYSFKEDVILDPFCGSGTTCLAAKQLGRYYIGYDIKEEYCKIAQKRLSEANYELFNHEKERKF
ncbi:DNA-methyltransferase [Persephonella sp.]